MQHLFAAVQVLDKFRDAAVIFKLDGFGFAGLGICRALVCKRDLQALIEECKFPQPLGQGVEVVFGSGENSFVGDKDCSY